MAVGTQDDEILDVGAVEFDRTVHEIVEPHRARRDAKADGARHAIAFARGDVVRAQSAARPIVLPGRAAQLGGITFHPKLLRRAIAVVGALVGDQALGHRPVTIESLGLEVRRVRPVDFRPLIPIEAEPPQAIEDAVDHVRR